MLLRISHLNLTNNFEFWGIHSWQKEMYRPLCACLNLFRICYQLQNKHQLFAVIFPAGDKSFRAQKPFINNLHSNLLFTLVPKQKWDTKAHGCRNFCMSDQLLFHFEIANLPKLKQQLIAHAEISAIMNLCISFLLVHKFGIFGGTKIYEIKFALWNLYRAVIKFLQS